LKEIHGSTFLFLNPTRKSKITRDPTFDQEDNEEDEHLDEKEVIHEPMPNPEFITPHTPASREVESLLGEERVVDQPDTVEETSVNPKKDSNGVVTKIKARLVAGGHLQNREELLDNSSPTLALS
jgi:hypothetical protein